MKVTFTWDDGAREDIKLFALHQKYDLQGMFFVPNENREGRDVLRPEEIRDNASELISFGGHTKTHVYLTEIDPNEIEKELLENKAYLEDLLTQPVDHFCLPGGMYNHCVLEKVNEVYKTCRTAETMNFRNKGNVIRPSFHMYPRGKKSLFINAVRHRNFGDGFKVIQRYKWDYFDIVEQLLREKNETDSQIVIWGHSWEIEELGLWNQVERIMEIVSSDYKECAVPYSDLFHDEAVTE